MLLWDLNTDEVAPGQWIRARVNVRNCDVTPDGRLLVAGLYDPGSRREPAGENSYLTEGWTAISRPPYFTALALWFDGCGGGGYWSTARDLHLFERMSEGAPDKGGVPGKIRRHGIGLRGQGDTRPVAARLRREGWIAEETTKSIKLMAGWHSDEAIVDRIREAGLDLAPLKAMRASEYPHWVRLGETRWRRPFDGGVLERVGTFEELERITLSEPSGEVRLELERPWNSWGWIDLDSRGRVIYSDRGCLWAWEDFPEGKPTMIADLNENKFQALPPPDWAETWPSNSVPEW